MKNSFIDSFVAFIVFMVVIFSLIKSVSINDNLVETKFKVMDRVYVLPDSIPAYIESTFIISVKQKVNGVRKRVIISENYTGSEIVKEMNYGSVSFVYNKRQRCFRKLLEMIKNDTEYKTNIGENNEKL